MMEAALVGGAVLVSGLSYVYGRMRAESDDGCNGHHWGEPYRPDEDGVSAAERQRAFKEAGQYVDYPEVPRKPHTHYEAKVLTDTVVLRGKAIKKCQDCGKRTVVDITVGSLPLEAFEDSSSR
jgi:hypothetical protein